MKELSPYLGDLLWEPTPGQGTGLEAKLEYQNVEDIQGYRSVYYNRKKLMVKSFSKMFFSTVHILYTVLLKKFFKNSKQPF